MSFLKLVLRSLAFYRRTHLAVLLGTAAGAAVIGGALVVGDSVKHSLRRLTLTRLGEVDFALSGGRFVTDGLVDSLDDSLARTPQADDSVVAPALALRAGVTSGEGDKIRRVGGANLYGTDDRLWGLLDTAGVDPPGPLEAVLNRRVAEGLNVGVGDEVTVAVEVPSAVPAGTCWATGTTRRRRSPSPSPRCCRRPPGPGGST